MSPFPKKYSGLFVLLMGIIVCSTLLSTPARAAAGFFGDDDDDDDSGWGWGNSEEKSEEVDQKSRSLNEGSADSVDHSQHHHHEPPVLAAGPLGSQGAQAASWDPAKQAGAGMQSGNYASHNESCSPTGKSCATGQNLVCSTNDGTGRCQCVSGYVYVRQTESCWYIPKSDEDPCAHDIQCHEGKWGTHSRCNKSPARCECYDYTGKRDTVLVDGVCYIKKSIGDLCRNHEECDKPIRGDAYCKLGDHQSGSGQDYSGSCQCRESHMFWSPLTACLKKSTKLGEKCYVTEQCQEGSLGQRSKCMPGLEAGEGTCECFSPHNGTEVVYYEKTAKCFKRREYNDTCTEADECRASLGPDVECGQLPVENPDENAEVDSNSKVCYCPTGRVCRNSAFSPLFAMSSYTLSMAFTVAIIGVSSMMNGMGKVWGC